MLNSNASKLIIIGGAGGVGKTSLINEFVKILERKPDMNFVVRNVGDYLKEALEARKQNSVERHQIRNSKWKTLESEVMHNIIVDFQKHKSIKDNLCFILDVHFAAPSQSGFMIGFDVKRIEHIACSILDDATSLNSTMEPSNYVAAVILIEADLLDIKKRRFDDSSRVRETSPANIIKDLEHNRVYSIMYYEALARCLGHRNVGYLQIENVVLSDTAEHLYKVLNDWNLLK